MTFSYASVDFSSEYPHSTLFDDRYYLDRYGYLESIYVYLDEGQLARRFSEKNIFTVAEIGFGTGLNFLACMELWKKTTEDDRKLIYIGFEKQPLSPDHLMKSLEKWPELGCSSKKLLENYIGLVDGVNILTFLEERIVLVLIIGDALLSLESLCFKADHWLLDGFAPKKNPSAWSFELLQAVTEHSAQGATFTTFTSAGYVRRALTSLGWDVIRCKGFLHKKHRIKGRLAKNDEAILPTRRPHIVIEGEGIAGSSCAFFLSWFGAQVTVISRPHQLASSCPYIKVKPAFQNNNSRNSYFSVKTHAFSSRLFNQLKLNYGLDIQFGLDERLATDEQVRKFEKIAQNDLTRNLIQKINDNHYYYPYAFTASGPEILNTLLNQNNVTVIQQKANMPQRTHSGWSILNQQYSHLVLANSFAAPSFISDLPVATMMRGQQSLCDRAIPSTFDRFSFVPTPVKKTSDTAKCTHNDFVGFRANSSNYLPLFGEYDDFTYLTLYYGSKGYTYAPYVGILVALDLLGLLKIKKGFE